MCFVPFMPQTWQETERKEERALLTVIDLNLAYLFIYPHEQHLYMSTIACQDQPELDDSSSYEHGHAHITRPPTPAS